MALTAITLAKRLPGWVRYAFLAWLVIFTLSEGLDQTAFFMMACGALLLLVDNPKQRWQAPFYVFAFIVLVAYQSLVPNCGGREPCPGGCLLDPAAKNHEGDRAGAGGAGGIRRLLDGLGAVALPSCPLDSAWPGVGVWLQRGNEPGSQDPSPLRCLGRRWRCSWAP